MAIKSFSIPTRLLARLLLVAACVGFMLFSFAYLYMSTPMGSSVDYPWASIRPYMRYVALTGVGLPLVAGALLLLSLIGDALDWTLDIVGKRLAGIAQPTAREE